MYLNAVLIKCYVVRPGVFLNLPLIISKCHVFAGEKAKLNCCDSVAKWFLVKRVSECQKNSVNYIFTCK